MEQGIALLVFNLQQVDLLYLGLQKGTKTFGAFTLDYLNELVDSMLHEKLICSILRVSSDVFALPSKLFEKFSSVHVHWAQLVEGGRG